MSIKIIELPIETAPNEVEKKLAGYEYIQSYPLEYRTAEGFIKVIRYFVNDPAPSKSKLVKIEKK
jgi:hypothetical protein